MKNNRVAKRMIKGFIEKQTPVDIHFGKGVALRNVQILDMDDIVIESTSNNGPQMHVIESLGSIAPAVVTHEGVY